MIYLIARAPRFSPNSEQRDAAIFQAVVLGLVLRGLPVCTMDEDALPVALSDAQLVLSMGRAPKTLHRLAEWEHEGVPILNSPTCLLRNTRSQLDALCAAAGSGTTSLYKETDVVRIEREVGYPLWLKRGDGGAETASDVRFVANRAALNEGLAFFAERGYTDFLTTAHVEGDLVKFYGVEGTPFFHHTFPTAGGGFSKFGLEVHNGAPKGHPFDPDRLKALADKVAHSAGMPIYGGDAIVRADGSIAVIDFNDWPSFGSCTQAAAAAIVERACAIVRTAAQPL